MPAGHLGMLGVFRALFSSVTEVRLQCVGQWAILQKVAHGRYGE